VGRRRRAQGQFEDKGGTTPGSVALHDDRAAEFLAGDGAAVQAEIAGIFALRMRFSRTWSTFGLSRSIVGCAR